MNSQQTKIYETQWKQSWGAFIAIEVYPSQKRKKKNFPMINYILQLKKPKKEQ